MEFSLIPFASGAIQKQAVDEVIKCNDYTKRFGLALTPEQAAELVETRSLALSANGRVEFGGGAIDKIIKAFCDSPYISKRNYTQTLHELIDIFYYAKNDTCDLIGDDDLIKFMEKAFDGVCQGSLDLLEGRELFRLGNNLRQGRPADYNEDESEEETLQEEMEDEDE